jgi:hypothetical protein
MSIAVCKKRRNFYDFTPWRQWVYDPLKLKDRCEYCCLWKEEGFYTLLRCTIPHKSQHQRILRIDINPPSPKLCGLHMLFRFMITFTFCFITPCHTQLSSCLRPLVLRKSSLHAPWLPPFPQKMINTPKWPFSSTKSD